MAKRLNVKEILATGSPRQKALLLIQNNEASVKQSGAFLTDEEVKAIIKSVGKDEREKEALRKYLQIAECYEGNRFRLYGLQENIKELTSKINSCLQLWELAEKQVEFCNTILGLADTEGVKGGRIARRADIERYIYQSCRSWNRYTPIRRKTDEEGNPLREVELDISPLMETLQGMIAHYKSSLGIVKSFVIASDEFMEKYHATAFIPGDVKEMIQYFKTYYMDIPDIYRRDSYLKLKELKGEDDREVKYRERYAIIPAWEEIEPRGLENARGAFTL